MEVTQVNGRGLQGCAASEREQTSAHTDDPDPQPKIHELLKSMMNSFTVMGMYFHVRRRRGSSCLPIVRRYGCITYSTLVMLFVTANVLYVQHVRIGTETRLVNLIKRIVWDIHSLSHFGFSTHCLWSLAYLDFSINGKGIVRHIISPLGQFRGRVPFVQSSCGFSQQSMLWAMHIWPTHVMF